MSSSKKVSNPAGSAVSDGEGIMSGRSTADAESRVRSGSKLEHAQRNFNSIAEENENIPLCKLKDDLSQSNI